MKKIKNLAIVLLIIGMFMMFAVASGDETTSDQGSANVADDTAIGDYSVEIAGCRLAKDYEGKPVVIIKYVFQNVNGDEPASFMFAFDDYASKNGVGLNEAYVLSDSAKYDESNQTKEIKKGASLDVEVAYELNDKTTDVEVEVKELFSFDEKSITKTFKIAK